MNKIKTLAPLLAATFSLGSAATPGPAAAPWTMVGTVRTEAGVPLAGVEVFADHTAYYNMNALGRTDAQGRYRIALNRQPGTWNAGAYLRLKLGDEPLEVRLSPDVDVPFDGSKGAARNFTLKAGDLPKGQVNTYVAHSAVELDYDTLELTFTPDGPNILGSAAAFTRRFVSGSGIQGVPLGRYKVSASQLLNGRRQQLLLSSADQKSFAPQVLAMFHDGHDRYGLTMELFLKNPE